MTFKNIQELNDEKERILYEKYLYDRALENAIHEQKKCSKIRNKRYWDQIIENYREKVQEFENKIKGIDMIYSNALRFPKELLMSFILECINLHEDENYVSRNKLISLTSHISTYGVLPTYANFEMIFPESILEDEIKLENTFYISVMQLAYLDLFRKSEVKYIMLPTEGYVNLLGDNLKLLTYFQAFPYLESIGINLVERRLREPDKKVVEILNEEIESLKDNKNSKNLCK